MFQDVGRVKTDISPRPQSYRGGRQGTLGALGVGSLGVLGGAMLFLSLLFAPFSLDAYWKRSYGHAFTGADMLNMQGNPRAIGIGEAYTAIADDIGALDYNPAGLGTMRWPQLRFWSGWEYVGLNIIRANCAYAHPIPYIGTLATSFTYMAYGTGGVQYILDASGNYYGKFTPRDTLYTFAWGRHIIYGLHLGMQGKYYEQVIKLKPEDAAAAEAMEQAGYEPGEHLSKAMLGDYGFLWVVPKVGLRVATSFQNTGESVDHYLPPDRVRFGIAYPIAGKFFESNPMTFVYEHNWLVGSGRVSCGGVEWNIARQIAFRVGYNMPVGYGYTKKGTRRALEGLRCGFGLGDEYFTLDYAYKYHEHLGSSHYLSSTITFGSDKVKPKKIEEKPEAVGPYIQPGSSPFNLTEKSGNRRVLLKWEPAYADNVQGFNIYRRKADGQRVKIVKAPIKKNRCVLRGLKNGKEYQFAVSIVFNDFEETFTPFISTTPFSILDQETANLKFAELVPSEFQAEERSGKLLLRWKNSRDKRIAGTYVLWKTSPEEDFRRLVSKPIKGKVMALPGKKVKGGKGLNSGTYYFIAQNGDGGEGELEKLSRPSMEIIVEFVSPREKAIRQAAAAEEAAAEAETEPDEDPGDDTAEAPAEEAADDEIEDELDEI